MTNFADVQTILDTATAAITGMPSIINGENERMKTSNVTSWARTELVTNETIAECIGVDGVDRLNGIYVIELFYPKGTGVAAANALVDTITIALESGTILTDGGSNRVEIFNSYPLGTTSNLENYYRKQIQVDWRARRQRTV